jgi:predicted Fe-Mo cluster-binding NifX family protein
MEVAYLQPIRLSSQGLPQWRPANSFAVARTELVLEEAVPVNRARRLQSLGVNVLICGAISRSLAEHLANAGIDVIPFVSGSVEGVLAAYLAGELESAQFLMPGSTAEERREWRTRREAHPVPPRTEGRRS